MFYEMLIKIYNELELKKYLLIINYLIDDYI
jgi:hypothetical protein